MNVHTYLGEIRMWSGDKAPGPGWAICDGKLLSINDFHMLYMIIGNIYGGDGWETFALPDLRGRIPVNINPGKDPSTVQLGIGQPLGTENSTLSAANIPSHTHAMMASKATGTMKTVSGSFLANSSDKQVYNNTPAKDPDPKRVQMGAKTVSAFGGPTQISIVQPFQSINFIIALEGQYVGPQLL